MVSRIATLLCVSLLVASQNLWAQKLTIEHLFESATHTYPSLIAARLDARAAAEDVSATERMRWPAISTTIESNSGNLRSSPSRALQVDQTVWDFGRASAMISASQAMSDATLFKAYLQQQDVFLQITSAWQNLISARERLKAAEATLDRLKAYQSQMRRRVDAEVSPRIDLELIDARILQTDVEYASAQTSYQVSLTRLEQLSGESSLALRVDDASYELGLLGTNLFFNGLKGVDWRSVANDHPVSAKARADVVQAQRRVDAKAAEAYPQMFVRIYKPIGTLLNNTDTSTTSFLGVRYSPGAGFSTFAEAKALATRMESAEQSVEVAVREMQQTLQNDYEELANARARIHALDKSVAGSAIVLESYQRQFQAGKKQWQDLLNQVRELAQNEYALADAQASMIASMYRLRIRMGQHTK